MKIQYFDILKRALLMTWNNKFLWVFGLFVFLGSITSNSSVDVENLMEQGKNAGVIGRTTEIPSQAALLIMLLVLFLMIGLFLLRIMGTAAIIKSVNDINLYKQLSIREIFVEARKSFWKMFFVEVLIGLSLLMIVVVLAIPTVYLFALNATVLAYVVLLAAAVIILPLLLLSYYLRRFANIYIILGGNDVKMSLELAYVLFAKNIKESLWMGLISIGLGMVLLAAILSACLLLMIVLAPFGLIAYLTLAKTGLMLVSIVGILFGIVIVGGLFSWYESFLQAIWVFFFQEIAFEKDKENKEAEKIQTSIEIPEPEAT